MKDFKKIIKYFSPVFKKHKWYFITGSFLFLLGNTLAHVGLPLFYKKIINVASLQTSNKLFNFSELWNILLLILLMLLIVAITRRAGSFLWSFFENKIGADIHNYSLEKVISNDYDFFTNHFLGSISNKVNRLGRNFRNLIKTIFFGFILLFVDIIFSIIVLLRENLLLGLVFLVFFIVFVLLSLYFSKIHTKLDKIRARYGSARSGVLSDILSNYLNIITFSSYKYESSLYERAVEKVKKAQFKTWFFQDRVRVYKNIFFILFEVLIMGVALYLFSNQKISLGTLVLVQSYNGIFILNAWHLSSTLVNFVEEFSDSIDAIDIVTSPLTILDIDKPLALKMNNGEIEFDNISFTYPKGDHVFEKFKLQIPAGQSVGIVGKSGSGKTTLTKLLLRLYDVNSGDINIDGQNISQVTQSDLRSCIAYIPQETILFHRSIYENIVYGDLHATHEQVMAAAVAAHVDEFVQNLTEKYETKVGERGVKLSGGQRQRIGIARAMLRKKAPILMLDEATSSLDSVSEKYIQNSFEKLSKNRTTIVIAHRLSTIQKMDRIIVMENGKIIEDGSHDNLISKNGHYAKLWNSQTNGFIQDE